MTLEMPFKDATISLIQSMVGTGDAQRLWPQSVDVLLAVVEDLPPPMERN